MKIILTGGTGFLGTALLRALAADGAEVVVFTRQSQVTAGGSGRPSHATYVTWTPDGAVGPWASEVNGATAVVNLAGESIAGHRWSAAHKQRILESRVQATRSIVAAIRATAAPPAVFISGSAVGYYGPRGDEIVTEQTPAGHDFLARVCMEWEKEAARAGSSQTRVAIIRTGLALERDGGALPQMLLPFRFGVGGPVGTGRQYWPWIHRRDWVDLVRRVLETPSATGPINATAPTPVTNREFARALGRVLHRPAFLPAPGFALKLALGEMADALLLSGQRAVPRKATELGFAFRFEMLDEALRAIFDAAPAPRV